MKLIDFDEKFNTKIAKYLAKHASERTEEEWEEFIADAYQKFGDTRLDAVGCTPRQYFSAMSGPQLVETLKEYLLQGIEVPDFLCEELEKRGAFPELLSLLEETDEELVHYALKLLGADERALPRYAQMLSSDAYDEHIKDAVAELLKQRADAVTDQMLALLGTESEPYALEILSGTKGRDERVYAALLRAFLSADEPDLPLYAGYLAAYGDERAILELVRAAGREDIGFVAFREIKFAIEALGGEYEGQRDFSSDPAYKKIMEAGKDTDIFGGGKQ